MTDTEQKVESKKSTNFKPTYKIPSPELRFSPYAYAKMVFMRDMSNNEVGGFGITYPEDPLLVEDFILVPQEVGPASVEFSDIGVADFVERMMEFNIPPLQCMRIWIHTHPGSMNTPSSTDEITFSNVFGKCNWAIMFILAQNDKTFCALQHNTVPASRVNINTSINFAVPFLGSNQEEWVKEYTSMVKETKIFVSTSYPIVSRKILTKAEQEERENLLNKVFDNYGAYGGIGEISDDEWFLKYGGTYEQI